MPDVRRPTPEVMATLYLALLLVAAALVSASDLDASFCADCKWKQSDFTCGFRVKFLVDHYKVKEEEAMQSLLDDGDCLPMADQEVAGGSMAAASATSISENTDVTGSDVVSERAKKPVPDVISQSEKKPGSDVVSESEKEPGATDTASSTESGIMLLASHGGVETTVVSFSDKESNGDSSTGEVIAAKDFVTLFRHGGSTVFLTVALVVLAAVVAVEHRRRKRLEQKLEELSQQMEQSFGQYRDQEAAEYGESKGEDIELLGQIMS